MTTDTSLPTFRSGETINSDHEFPRRKTVLGLPLPAFATAFGYVVTMLLAWWQIQGSVDSQNYAMIIFFIGIMTTQIVSIVIAQLEMASAVEFLKVIDKSIDHYASSMRTSVEKHSASVTNQVSDLSRDIAEKLETMADCVHLGRAETAMNLLMNELDHADEVRDSLIVHGVNPHSVLFAIYNSSNIGTINDKVTKFVQRGGKWTQLVSERFCMHKDVGLYKAYTDLLETNPDNFRCFIARDEYPIINVTIVEHSGVGTYKKRAYFGWGHFKGEANGHVFLTENPNLIKMLEDYWEAVMSDCVILDDHAKSCCTTAISGAWCGVSYTKPGADKPISIRDQALITISFDGRNIQVHGDLFDDKGSDIGYFDSTSARLKGSRLYSSYETIADRTGQGRLTTMTRTASSAHYDFNHDGKGYTGIVHEDHDGAFVKLMGEKLDDFDPRMSKTEVAALVLKHVAKINGDGKQPEDPGPGAAKMT